MTVKTETAALVVIGGFPGAGKSLICERLCRELSLPLLSSDQVGGTIRDVLRGKVESSDAFRAGYEVLFTLAETFLRSGCSVVIDTNMGWEFQWQRVDRIAETLPHVALVPVILQCPRNVAIERIGHRHHDSDGQRSTAAKILTLHPHVWEYLEQLDRPDIHTIDANQAPELVYAQTLRYLLDRVST